jgi:hypothetical protein
MELTWSILTMTLAASKNFSSIMAIRFFVGECPFVRHRRSPSRCCRRTRRIHVLPGDTVRHRELVQERGAGEAGVHFPRARLSFASWCDLTACAADRERIRTHDQRFSAGGTWKPFFWGTHSPRLPAGGVSRSQWSLRAAWMEMFAAPRTPFVVSR